MIIENEAIKRIKEEFERSLHLSKHPEESPELYDVIGSDNVSLYWSWRAEGLGFALDRLYETWSQHD